MDATGTVTLAYDTAGRLLPTGEQRLTVRYGETADLTSGMATLDVTLAKRGLDVSIASVDAKTYDATAQATGVLRLAGALSDDAPTATGTFVWSGEDAGTDRVSVSAIELDAGSMPWYTAVVALPEQDAAGATIMAAEPAVEADSGQSFAAGATVANLAAPSTTGVDGEALSGTVAWFADEAHAKPLAAATALVDGTPYYWVFTPDNANYVAIDGSVLVNVAPVVNPDADGDGPVIDTGDQSGDGSVNGGADVIPQTGDVVPLPIMAGVAAGFMALLVGLHLRRLSC